MSIRPEIRVSRIASAFPGGLQLLEALLQFLALFLQLGNLLAEFGEVFYLRVRAAGQSGGKSWGSEKDLALSYIFQDSGLGADDRSGADLYVADKTSLAGDGHVGPKLDGTRHSYLSD